MLTEKGLKFESKMVLFSESMDGVKDAGSDVG